MSLKTLAKFSSWIIPALLIVLVALAWMRRSRGLCTGKFLAASAVALLVTYLLAHINRWFLLWPANPVFPSGHATFLACAATSIFLVEWRTIFITLPLALGYAVLLVLMKWHSALDVIGALVFAPPVALLCHSLLERRCPLTALRKSSTDSE